MNRIGSLHAVIDARLTPRRVLIVSEGSLDPNDPNTPLGFNVTGTGPYSFVYDAEVMIQAAVVLDDEDFQQYIFAVTAIVLLMLANHGATLPLFPLAFQQIAHISADAQSLVRDVMWWNEVEPPAEVEDPFVDYMYVHKISSEEEPAAFAAWMEQLTGLPEDNQKE